MTRSYEAILKHTNSGNRADGVDTNHDVTVDNRGAVEIGE